MKALVVDDDKGQRRALQKLLQSSGFDVTLCADAGNAWDCFEKNGYRLVLLDWMLPDADGLDLCRRMRSAVTEYPPVILVVTSRTRAEDLRAVLDAGADDYIAKPVDASVLNVRLAIARRRIDEVTKNYKDEQMRLFLASIVDSTDDAVVGNNLGGEIVSWNDGARRMFGYAAEEAVGQSLAILFPADSVDRLSRLLERIRAGERIEHFETVRIRKDGLPVEVSLNYSPVRNENGEVTGGASIVRDITESKRLERQLRESQQHLLDANLELMRIASLDGLTGIANRRIFDQRLGEEWRRARREHAPLSLIMADIDFFKAYNDSQGHLAGDDCIRHVAKLLQDSACRPADLAVRYGGEEFAVLLPNTGLAGARVVAEKFRASVESLGMEHQTSKVSPYVTVSVGVATMTARAAEMSADNLLKAADHALYEAKAKGRNQVRVAESPS